MSSDIKWWHTTNQKFGASKTFEEISTFIQQGCIKLLSNHISNITKYFYFK